MRFIFFFVLFSCITLQCKFNNPPHKKLHKELIDAVELPEKKSPEKNTTQSINTTKQCESSPLVDVTEKKTPATTSSPLTKKPRIITVKNSITPDMITYKKHWTGNHTPSQLSVTINDKEWEFSKKAKKNSAPETQTIELDNEKATVELYYQFKAAGITYKEDTKKYTCIVPSTIEHIEMSFTWEGEQKVLLEGEDSETLKKVPLTALNN